MARVRYLGPEQVTVPELGRTVEPDEIVEVPDERFEGYACQPSNWEVIEEPKDEAAPAPLKKTAAKASQKTEG
ncbi:hypothetical protein [Streptomyces sp. NBC_00582]|uniref:hypothetical protein n=1 Tax=Streptomyces sp. NBC_00582 TaxID=2975783 RepID=UPI002E801AF4|nr:hypothetical protein [Streptomyces sp. NBC_00582]WUB61540.1 hypothetical protein OG852_14630 [Streptomyces sp. NBC_00582]